MSAGVSNLTAVLKAVNELVLVSVCTLEDLANLSFPVCRKSDLYQLQGKEVSAGV